ncbi:MAG: sodium-translocating pyrophosphatase [Planctomycetes bacterium]|nr:sodium-translocating pyrophosphatase [Planctomycetota bacterium]
MSTLALFFAGAGAVLALVFAFKLYKEVMARDEGEENMRRIAKQVQDGAKAFLTTEYRWLAIFVSLVFVVFLLTPSADGLGWRTAVSFLLGAAASAVAGWIGMHTATRAAVRTTQAAKNSLSDALHVSFSSGAVMGLVVVGLGLAGITVLYFVFDYVGAEKDGQGLQYILGFSFGASTIALFARVGGGIYTKAADVGADLVGKVEAGIPEDDPRNPAVIADNVGDNVGDVAGMGADLFESYVGSILAAMVLAAASFVGVKDPSTSVMVFPLVIAAIGIVASIVGTFFVKSEDESGLSAALFRGLLVASGVLIVGGAIMTLIMQPEYTAKTLLGEKVTYGAWSIYGAIVVGLVIGVIIGRITEYYTSEQKGPAQEIANQSQTGAATNIIHGLATGMLSTALPIVVVCIGIMVTYDLAGIYGIAVAAVGMLSTLGISLGVDAYGPVADNAGGLAEMAGLDPSVRQKTDALDATGNMTAAMGKGFAIGSAALTALALFATFNEKVEERAKEVMADLSKQRIAAESEDAKKEIEERQKAIVETSGSLSLNTPRVIMGLLFGAMLPFLFSALTMRAVGRAANKMIEEVRRQFRDIPGLREGKEGVSPDSASCVSIATQGAIREMIAPGLLAILAPILIGKFFGVSTLGGMLGGALASGVMMAIFMANAGGAWDNAKKYIEGGHFGGKGSDAHKAAVVGDTVGDPFKDTSGPSINILIKLMSIVAVVFVPWFISA